MMVADANLETSSVDHIWIVRRCCRGSVATSARNSGLFHVGHDRTGRKFRRVNTSYGIVKIEEFTRNPMLDQYFKFSVWKINFWSIYFVAITMLISFSIRRKLKKAATVAVISNSNSDSSEPASNGHTNNFVNMDYDTIDSTATTELWSPKIARNNIFSYHIESCWKKMATKINLQRTANSEKVGKQIQLYRYPAIHLTRSSPGPTISSLLVHSCPGFATYWRMNKCCVT